MHFHTVLSQSAFFSPGISPLKKSRPEIIYSGAITSSLVASTALHVDGLTKLGTSATTSLSYVGSDFCAWFTLSSHAVSAHPESLFRLCYSHPSSALLFTTLPSPHTDKHPPSSL